MTRVESISPHNLAKDPGPDRNHGPARNTREAANDQCLQVQGEIWRAVTEAGRSDGNLSLRAETRRIAKAFPTSGYSPQDIKDALVFAAVDVGVAVAIAPPAEPSARASAPVIDVRALLRGNRKRTRKIPRKAATLSLQEATV